MLRATTRLFSGHILRRGLVASQVSRISSQNMSKTTHFNSIRCFSDLRKDFGVSDELLVSLSMNYNNSGTSHTTLCDNLKKNNLIQTPLLEYSFRKCDRATFDSSSLPYEDKPHDIGAGATISSAHMHCIALEALAECIVPRRPTETTPVRSFLDVGAGSGYISAIFASVICALKANPCSTHNASLSRVTAIELHPGLAAQAIDNLTTANSEFTKGDDPIVSVISEDAFSPVALPNAPFDAIHCGVATPTIPYSLLAQLKIGGKIITPVARPESMEQDLIVFTRKSTATPEMDEFIQEAHQLTPEKSEAWLREHFDRRIVMRCIYSMAQNKETPTSNIPVLNPRVARGGPGAAATEYSKFFKGTEVTPEQQAAYTAYLNEQKEEMLKLIKKLEDDVDHKKAELQKTSDEVVAWHAEFRAKNNYLPKMEEMLTYPKVATLLRLNKELRAEVARSERALAAALKKIE